MAEANHPVNEVAHPTVHYEPDDVSFRGVLLFAFWLLVATAIMYVGLLWLFNMQARPHPGVAMPTTLLTESERQRIPPEPRLQISPIRDMRELRAAEDAVLQTYGWVDQHAGLVRVPIERAMEIIATQGIPSEEGIKN